MPLKIRCPSDHALKVPDNYVGRTVRCPICEQKFTVVAELITATVSAPETAPPKAVTGSPSPHQTAEKPTAARAKEKLKKRKRAKQPVSVKPQHGEQSTSKDKLDSQTSPKSDQRHEPPEQSAKNAQSAARNADLLKKHGGSSSKAERRDDKTRAIQPTVPAADSSGKPTKNKRKKRIKRSQNSSTAPPPASAKAKSNGVKPSPKQENTPHKSAITAKSERAASEESPSQALPKEPTAAPSTAADKPPTVDSEPARKIVTKPTLPDATAPVIPTMPPMLVQGVEHNRDKRWTVYYLGIGLVALALCSMYPAVTEIVEYFQSDSSVGINRWAYGVLLLGMLQLAYVVYLVQLPDWSTTWAVMFLAAALATFYAAGLAVASMATKGSAAEHILSYLQLTVQQNEGKLSGWCFIMLMLCFVTTYFAFRITHRWHKAYMLTH